MKSIVIEKTQEVDKILEVEVAEEVVTESHFIMIESTTTKTIEDLHKITAEEVEENSIKEVMMILKWMKEIEEVDITFNMVTSKDKGTTTSITFKVKKETDTIEDQICIMMTLDITTKEIKEETSEMKETTTILEEIDKRLIEIETGLIWEEEILETSMTEDLQETSIIETDMMISDQEEISKDHQEVWKEIEEEMINQEVIEMMITKILIEDHLLEEVIEVEWEEEMIEECQEWEAESMDEWEVAEVDKGNSMKIDSEEDIEVVMIQKAVTSILLLQKFQQLSEEGKEVAVVTPVDNTKIKEMEVIDIYFWKEKTLKTLIKQPIDYFVIKTFIYVLSALLISSIYVYKFTFNHIKLSLIL